MTPPGIFAPECLRQQIESAFSGLSYPGDDSLVTSESVSHPEWAEVAQAFRGRHWSELPLELLRYHYDALFVFTPEAYRYYLPAFILASAIHYREADTLSQTVVFTLIPPADVRDLDSYLKRVEGLTADQKSALKSFLAFLKKEYSGDDPAGDIDKALATL